jgi:carboxyl-terminal processing protease
LIRQGATKFILDLRNNPGGYLDAAVDVSDIFLDSALVVEERRGDVVLDKMEAEDGGVLVGKPLVVLINEGSASASEIVAGALKDNQAAKLVGEKTYGKGSVQELKQLSGGSALKVTIASWYTPSGRNITKEGIQPDVEVKLEVSDAAANRDPQLDRALELLK